MVERALEQYPSIELARSILIGDSASDVELAIAVGLRAFAIGQAAYLAHPLVTAVDGLAGVAGHLETADGLDFGRR